MAGGFRSLFARWLGGASAPPETSAVIGLVQNQAGTTATITMDGAFTAGNLVVVIATWANTTATITSVSDNASGSSNTYEHAGTVATGSAARADIWYCYNCKAATEVTPAWSDSTVGHVNVSEWENAATDSSVYGGSGSAYLDNNNPFNYAEVTPTENGCLVIAGLRTDTSYTVSSREGDWAALEATTRLDAQYDVQTTAAATDGTTTFSGNEVVVGKIAWFTPAAEAPAATFNIAPLAYAYYRQLRG